MHGGVRLLTRLAVLTGLGVLGSCLPIGLQASGGGVGPSKLRAMTESYHVTAMATTPQHLWTGTDRGLLRWDLATNRADWITYREGLPGKQVRQLAAHPSGALFVATESGLSHYSGGGFRNLPAPPVGDLHAMVTTKDGQGVWAGGSAGLAVNRFGKWSVQLGGVPVTSLAHADSGALLVGTDGAGLLEVRGDRVFKLEGPLGVALTKVTAVAGRPVGATAGTITPLAAAVGTGPAGPTLAVFDARGWRSYRLESGLFWLGIGARGLLARASTHLERITFAAPETETGLLPLPRCPGATPRPVSGVGALRNWPTERCEKPEVGGNRLVLNPDTRLPDDVSTLVMGEGSVWAGTPHLGCSRLDASETRAYRTHDLVPRRTTRVYAVHDGKVTYIASGRPWLWRFDGENFEREVIDPAGVLPGAAVVAILRDSKGEIWAVHRRPNEAILRFSQRAEGRWVTASARPIDIPSTDLDVLFANFAPDGKLWLGVAYRDTAHGEARPAGLAVIDEAFERVRYHRVGGGLTPVLPNTVRGVAFRTGEVWVATSGGMVRMAGGKTTTFTENDGLKSEVIMDVAIDRDNMIWAATRAGVGRFDGKMWRFESEGALSIAARALVRTPTGIVWAGTDQGAVRLEQDGATSSANNPRYVAAAIPTGLEDPAVLDITSDGGTGVWLLARRALALITQ